MFPGEAGGLAFDVSGLATEEGAVDLVVQGATGGEVEAETIGSDAAGQVEVAVGALLVATQPEGVAGVVAALLEAEADLPGVALAVVLDELALVAAVLVFCAGEFSGFGEVGELQGTGAGGETAGELVEEAVAAALVGGLFADGTVGVFEPQAPLSDAGGLEPGELCRGVVLSGGGVVGAVTQEVFGADL